MKIGKSSTSASIALSPISKSEHEVIPVPKSSTINATSTVNKASSQMQLLGLAKQFMLDGGLVSPDKQMPLEDRSRKRIKLSKLRKQQNLEAIIQRALGYCPDDEVAERADQDWFNSYISLAEDISNRTMQDLWAKILAGEIAQPGSYSFKALKVLRDMSMHDAKLLARATTLSVKDNTKKSYRIISGSYQMPGFFNFFNKSREQHVNISRFGLNYADLLTLADNNLLFIQEAESSPMTKQEELHFNYNGLPLHLTAKKNDTIIRFYKFTPIGSELAQLISDKTDLGYFKELKLQLSFLFDLST